MLLNGDNIGTKIILNFVFLFLFPLNRGILYPLKFRNYNIIAFVPSKRIQNVFHRAIKRLCGTTVDISSGSIQ